MKRTATLQHMFILLLSLATMAGSAFSALGQGTETFDNLELSGTSYADGSFLGQDGSTWTYVQCRGDYAITGKAIMIGRNRTPQAYFESGTISGGIGVLNFDYMQAFSTAVNLNVLVNDAVVSNVTASDEQGTIKNSGNITVEVEGDFVIKFINADNSDGQVVVDNIIWTAPGVVPGDPPVIGSVTQTPENQISTETSVSVSAEVTEGTATLSKVELHWGTASGDYPNTINMTKGSGNTYTTDTGIPTQSDGTTVYYIVYAEDVDGESDTSAEYNYFVVALSEWDGFETFDNLELSGTSYADGSFTGQDGSTWTFVQSRGDIAITGKALMLGRNRSPQAYLLSGTLTGGIGIIQFDYMQAFGTGVNLNVLVNDVVAGNVTSADEQGVVKSSGDIVVNVAGPFELKFINANNSDGQVVIDNIRWKNYTTDGNIPPVITNITQNPSADISSSTTVSVSADVTDTDGTVEQVELRWGTTAGSHPNTIAMNIGSGNTYTTVTDIPAQTDGTTVYYVVYAEDNEGDSSVSGERSYTVQDPLSTTLPYANTFDSELGDIYVYNASGASRSWVHRTAADNGYAEMNGFNTGDVEEDWLILPGINMNDYETVLMTFNTYWQYGEDDESNYLKLLYSTDYAGIGNTAEATWHELDFTRSSTAQVWTESGQVDLSGISAEQVFVAFKYRYETGKYRLWRVDNISLAEEAQPGLFAMPSYISQYTYEVGQGPSDIYVFTLSGANLDGSNVSLTAPESFEIALSDQVFGSNLTLDAFDGSDTNILTRMKAGLDAGNYMNEQLVISGGGAEAISVSLEGVVFVPQTHLVLPYYNPLRTEDDNAAALDDGFSIHEATQATAAGGYLRIFPDGYVQSPPIMLAELGGLSIAFDATTFGGTTGQTLTVKVSDDEGASFSNHDSWEITGSYVTYEYGIDPNDYTSESVILRLEMTAGTNSTRLRELHIFDPEAEYMVHFTVTDGEDPIEGALITIGEASQTTGAEGKAGFSLLNGDYTYNVTAEGYQDITDGTFKVMNLDLSVLVVMEPLVLAALEVMPDALSGFAYDLGDGPSDAQPFVLSGEGLDGTNVTIDAPASFEIGLEEATSFSSGITLEAYDGSETTIQVRLKAGLEAGTYSGEEVSISGGGAEAISVSLEGVVLAPQTPLSLPYYNPLRTEDDNAAALADDFSIYEATQATAAGGYLRIFADGYIQSPPIMLAELGGLSIAFDATTFGGTTGQTLSVKVSDDGGISFSDIQAYEIPGSYETFETAIDLQTYTSESVILRLEMTAGTNSTRLRELHIFDPQAEYMVHFTVTDGEDPIEGALITIGEASQTTNAEGIAEFSLPNGTYTYAVTAEGYEDISDGQLSVMNADVNETVVMTASVYTINASAGDNGSIDPSGEISVNHGEDQVFTVNPNQGYRIAFVSVDGSNINLGSDSNWNAGNRQYTFSNVTQNHTIEAGFEVDDTGLTPAGLAELKLYPNPVAGMLYVESTDYITRLDIIDMTGRLVYREEPLTQQLSIDTGALFNGIYFVRIVTANGMTTKRIQVAR